MTTKLNLGFSVNRMSYVTMNPRCANSTLRQSHKQLVLTVNNKQVWLVCPLESNGKMMKELFGEPKHE